MQDFRSNLAWQKAHGLVLGVYEVTEQFPKAHMFSLTAQLRRSATSTPLRIAEACGRKGSVDAARALSQAYASLMELDYLLLLAHDLRLLQDAQHTKLHQSLVEARKVLAGFTKAVEQGVGQPELVAL